MKETEIHSADSEALNAPKRGRGRPRTRPPKDPNAPKRGRGRPPKPVGVGDDLQFTSPEHEAIVLDLQRQLESAIRKKKLNYTQFAEILSASPAYISRILHKNVNFSVKTLLRAAEVLDCELIVQLRRKKG